MKKSIFVKVLAILTAAVLLIASFAGCAGNESSASDNSSSSAADKEESKSADVVYRTLDEIKSSGKIKIGVFSDKNPFGYVDENGETVTSVPASAGESTGTQTAGITQ